MKAHAHASHLTHPMLGPAAAASRLIKSSVACAANPLAKEQKCDADCIVLAAHKGERIKSATIHTKRNVQCPPLGANTESA